MGQINPASIRNTAGDIIQAIMMKVIPAINDNNSRLEALEQKMGGMPSIPGGATTAPKPASPMAVDATPPPAKAEKKPKATKKKPK